MANEDKSARLDRVEQILAEMAENHKKEAKKNEKRAAENDRSIEELRKSSKSVDRLLKKLGKQVGGANNRWGKIIEDLVAGDLSTIAQEALSVHLSYISTRAHPPRQELGN